MYLKRLRSSKESHWKVLTLIEGDAAALLSEEKPSEDKERDNKEYQSDLEIELMKFGSKKYPEKLLYGFFALFNNIPRAGPQNLTNDSCHYADPEKTILRFRKGDYRVYGFIDNGAVVIVSHAAIKKGRKTDASDIAKALRLRTKYLKAKTDNEIVEI